jgi:hypothetical protein
LALSSRYLERVIATVVERFQRVLLFSSKQVLGTFSVHHNTTLDFALELEVKSSHHSLRGPGCFYLKIHAFDLFLLMDSVQELPFKSQTYR